MLPLAHECFQHSNLMASGGSNELSERLQLVRDANFFVRVGGSSFGRAAKHSHGWSRSDSPTTKLRATGGWSRSNPTTTELRATGGWSRPNPTTTELRATGGWSRPNPTTTGHAAVVRGLAEKPTEG